MYAELKEIDCVSETIGWKCMLAKIKERLSYDWNKKIYLAAYTDDGQCLCIYEKQ